MRTITDLWALSTFFAQDYQPWHPWMSHADWSSWLDNIAWFWLIFWVGIFAFCWLKGRLGH